MNTIKEIKETIRKTIEKRGQKLYEHHLDMIQDNERILELCSKLMSESNLSSEEKEVARHLINTTSDLIKYHQNQVKMIQPTLKSPQNEKLN